MTSAYDNAPPEVKRMLAAMTGTATPKPRKADRVREKKFLKRAAMGTSEPKQRDMKEQRFQSAVEAKARQLGWYPWHCHDPMRSGAGFPDLVLFKERTIWAELKVYYDNGRANRLSGVQETFHSMLKDAGQEVYVWYDDKDGWLEIIRVLSNGRLTA